MEESDPVIVIAFGIFFIVIIGLAIAIQTALIRWLFRINEQIKLLTKIKDELRKIRLKKYPENREEDEK